MLKNGNNEFYVKGKFWIPGTGIAGSMFDSNVSDSGSFLGILWFIEPLPGMIHEQWVISKTWELWSIVDKQLNDAGSVKCKK